VKPLEGLLLKLLNLQWQLKFWTELIVGTEENRNVCRTKNAKATNLKKIVLDFSMKTKLTVINNLMNFFTDDDRQTFVTSEKIRYQGEENDDGKESFSNCPTCHLICSFSYIVIKLLMRFLWFLSQV